MHAQEMARFNRLLAVMRDSLNAINLALQGLAVMSAELEAATRQLGLNQVPDLWRAASYPSLCPLSSYLQDLWRRLDMLADWDKQGPPPAFWLPGFFFVQVRALGCTCMSCSCWECCSTLRMSGCCQQVVHHQTKRAYCWGVQQARCIRVKSISPSELLLLPCQHCLSAAELPDSWSTELRAPCQAAHRQRGL